MRRLLVAVIMAIALVLVPASAVVAVNLNPDADCGDVPCGDGDSEDLEGRIPGVVNAILWIAGVLAVGMIIYSGVRMVMSQGDAGKVAQEKKTITYAVTGLIIVVLAYAIVTFVVGQFGG